jgi:hypothetical protein
LNVGCVFSTRGSPGSANRIGNGDLDFVPEPFHIRDCLASQFLLTTKQNANPSDIEKQTIGPNTPHSTFRAPRFSRGVPPHYRAESLAMLGQAS